MNTTSKSILIAAALAGLSACERQATDPAVVFNGQPSQVAVRPGPVVQGTVRDPSLPDAATVIAQMEADEKAKADPLGIEKLTVLQAAEKLQHDKEAAAATAMQEKAAAAVTDSVTPAEKTRVN
jgi:hypothetical protein